MHPGHVAFQSIDLTVVSDVAVRMGQLPTRKSVRRKTLVHQAKRASDVWIRELTIKIGNLRRQKQAFVNDSPRRERGNVEELLVFDVRFPNLLLSPFANDV